DLMRGVGVPIQSGSGDEFFEKKYPNLKEVAYQWPDIKENLEMICNFRSRIADEWEEILAVFKNNSADPFLDPIILLKKKLETEEYTTYSQSKRIISLNETVNQERKIHTDAMRTMDG